MNTLQSEPLRTELHSNVGFLRQSLLAPFRSWDAYSNSGRLSGYLEVWTCLTVVIFGSSKPRPQSF
jgi:hypothetical protein